MAARPGIAPAGEALGPRRSSSPPADRSSPTTWRPRGSPSRRIVSSPCSGVTSSVLAASIATMAWGRRAAASGQSSSRSARLTPTGGSRSGAMFALGKPSHLDDLGFHDRPGRVTRAPRRREDDAVAVLVHGPAVTPLWGDDRQTHRSDLADGGCRCARHSALNASLPRPLSVSTEGGVGRRGDRPS